MIFDGKPAQSITADEIRHLVTNSVTEDQHLDYKQRAYDPSDRGKLELLKDATAFLNADGGYLVIGVREDGSGRAVGFASVDDPEGVRRSMLDRCLHGIDPRPPHLNVGLHTVDGNNIVIVHVPESDRKPHCARPDAEHHYFWRRYEDGNKLMTMAEIRECLEGDRVQRELAELRREVAHIRHERTVEREMALEVDEAHLLRLETAEAFLEHVERRFMAATGDRPFYRLFACPVPVNGLNLNDHIAALRDLLANPPALRAHGWDLKPLGVVRVTAVGLEGGDDSYHDLRVFRNGYLEFRTPADDESFYWAQSGSPKPVNPHAIIEPAACFALLAKEVCRMVEYDGVFRFGLGLHNVKGMYLLPYAPNAVGYSIRGYHIGQAHGPQPLDDEHLTAPEFDVRASDLPGSVAWRLISDVYYRFGYTDEQIPFFGDNHECTLGNA